MSNATCIHCRESYHTSTSDAPRYYEFCSEFCQDSWIAGHPRQAAPILSKPALPRRVLRAVLMLALATVATAAAAVIGLPLIPSAMIATGLAFCALNLLDTKTKEEPPL